MTDRQRRIEYGDFQTPDDLALAICRRLAEIGVKPDVIVEPTCGLGAFVEAAATVFPQAARILGFDVNHGYLETLRRRLPKFEGAQRIDAEEIDFFATDWTEKLRGLDGSLLVLGNLPWVTNAAQGCIGGSNLPEKSNFQNRRGFDAITGKANFDISEWMLLEILRWFHQRAGYVAMLVKTSVARKVLAYVEQQQLGLGECCLVRIDAKRHFGASVDACLLVMEFPSACVQGVYDYTVFENLDDRCGHRVGHRAGLAVSDLEGFGESSHLLGQSPQKWRSGVKHDAAAVMEFRLANDGLENGRGERVDIEPTFIYPLLKGADVGGGKPWRGRYVLVTQRAVGGATEVIRTVAPRTWAYLEENAKILDGRGSTIYAKNPRFSVFGIGDYAFRPWKIAICGLYKSLRFRLVGPIEGKPAMFDDTVYYVSFDTEAEALAVLESLNSRPAVRLLLSLIFWDEKRPIKSAILNRLDWSRLGAFTGEGARDLFESPSESLPAGARQVHQPVHL